MRRSLARVLVASYLVLVFAIAFGASCSERCADDAADARCAPMCASCACCPHPGPSASLPVVGVSPARTEYLARLVILAPCEPDPADILHVPKRLLA